MEQKNLTNTFFPRPDKNLSDKDGKKLVVRQMMLWIADEHEKAGRTELAQKFRDYIK